MSRGFFATGRIAVPGMPRGSPTMEIPDASKGAFAMMAFDGEGQVPIFPVWRAAAAHRRSHSKKCHSGVRGKCFGCVLNGPTTRLCPSSKILIFNVNLY
jgi:hypothetical protein